MLKKSLDGITKGNTIGAKFFFAKATQVDSIVKLARRPQNKISLRGQVLASVLPKKNEPQFFAANFISAFYSRKKIPLLLITFALLLAFSGGMWVALNTASSRADTAAPEVLGTFTDQPSGSISLPDAQLPAQNSVSNDILFNTPIEYLKNYLAAVNEPDIISHRKDLLTSYLQGKNSPFAAEAETIAQQPHWQLILAIAFAESTLGKNCNDNNCSNIGVKPGHPSWRRYASYKDWVIDFNRLLDKRYNDWTLEQMCGVYVKPCNPNWLAATKQILGELKDQGIE